MRLVLDASIALAWCFEDEQTPTIRKVAQHVGAHGAVVPAIWRLEIANGLRAGVRRGRIVSEKRDEMLLKFQELPITLDSETNHHAWEMTVALSDYYQLTPYDASYLELAQRLSLPLATLDAALIRAAKAANITLAL